jgi:hypothetical protein
VARDTEVTRDAGIKEKMVRGLQAVFGGGQFPRGGRSGISGSSLKTMRKNQTGQRRKLDKIVQRGKKASDTRAADFNIKARHLCV